MLDFAVIQIILHKISQLNKYSAGTIIDRPGDYFRVGLATDSQKPVQPPCTKAHLCNPKNHESRLKVEYVSPVVF